MTSPRLRAVRDQRDADALWAELAADGAPLVEESGRLVTFLWRDDGSTRDVVVVGGPARWDPLDEDRMERILGTDVWYRSYPVEPPLVSSYQLSPNDSLEPPERVEDWAARESTFRADPLNPRRLRWPANPADSEHREHDCSLLAVGVELRDPAPDAPPPVEHVVASRGLGNSRRVWVHEPPTAAGARLLIVLDGWVWARVLPLGRMLAELRERTGPLLVALVEALDDATRVRELEGNPEFVRFLADELVPELRARYGVEGRIGIAGQSLGGLTAVAAALDRPDLVEVAGAQSGSFWWPRDASDRPQEHLTARVLEQEPVGARILLETGLLEGPDMVDTARRLHAALTSRGYAVDHLEHHGGHDWVRWWHDLPGLLARMYA